MTNPGQDGGILQGAIKICFWLQMFVRLEAKDGICSQRVGDDVIERSFVDSEVGIYDDNQMIL